MNTIETKTQPEIIILEDICEVKLDLHKAKYVPDNLIYCSNICNGFPTDDLPCPQGMYRKAKYTGKRFSHLRLYRGDEE